MFECNYFSLFILVEAFTIVCAWGRGDMEKYGPFQLALNSNLFKCDHNRSLNLDVSGTYVHFYDFDNNFNEVFHIDTAAKGILGIENLNKNKKFIIFVPGYKSNVHKPTQQKVIETFKNLPNVYFVILDHSTYTNGHGGKIDSYERSVKYVYYLGKAVGTMLSDLYKGGIRSKSFHCIGHSLGSQMLAHVGETYFQETGQKLARITGLDPAGPCFTNSPIEEQIRSGVAEYVEVYHCNAGGLGTKSVLADIDFFVNRKGLAQPNCGTPLIPGLFDSSKAAKCNHRTCVTIYLASVNHKDWFPASKCDTYRNFRNGSCSRNDVTMAGFWNPGKATGVFYFSTEDYDLS